MTGPAFRGTISVRTEPGGATVKDVMTAKEAAAQLGYHLDYLYRLLQQGKVHGRRWGREWMIDAEEVRRVKALQDEYGRLR